MTPAAALRTGRVYEFGRLFQRGPLFSREPDVMGKLNGKIFVGNTDRSAILAVRDRDRSPPIPLPGEAPISKPVGEALAAEAAGLGKTGHPLHRLTGAHPGIWAGVDKDSIILGRSLRVFLWAWAVSGRDYGPDGQAVFPGEFEIPLVMGGHRHNSACAVVHQNVGGDPDRDLLPGERVDRFLGGVDPFLFGLLLSLFHPGGPDSP